MQLSQQIPKYILHYLLLQLFQICVQTLLFSYLSYPLESAHRLKNTNQPNTQLNEQKKNKTQTHTQAHI